MIFFKTRKIDISAICACVLLLSSFVILAATKPSSQLSPEIIKAVEKKSQQLVTQMMQQTNKDKKIIFAILETYVQQNPQVYGASFAFAPVKNAELIIKQAPYVYRSGKGLKKIDLSESYDYTTQDWFATPAQLKKPTWSKPYFDQGGGNEWMITYSIPVYSDKEKSQLIGIITNDVLVENKK